MDQPLDHCDGAIPDRDEGDVSPAIQDRAEIGWNSSDLDIVQLQLEEVRGQLSELQEEFQQKIKFDTHKNQLIDRLHAELQGFKSELSRSFLKSFILDIIKIVDDIQKTSRYHIALPIEKRNPVKLIEALQGISTDLEDLISCHGIQSFRCGQTTFDPKRQRVLNKIETTDADKDKTIAESLRSGYEWEGTVLRPELVSAYIYASKETEKP